MAKRYSDEFKQKLIDEYFAGGISYRNLAKKYGVSKTFVWKLCLPIVRERKIAESNRRIEEHRSKRRLYAVGSDCDPSVPGNINRYDPEEDREAQQKKPSRKFGLFDEVYINGKRVK